MGDPEFATGKMGKLRQQLSQQALLVEDMEVELQHTNLHLLQTAQELHYQRGLVERSKELEEEKELSAIEELKYQNHVLQLELQGMYETSKMYDYQEIDEQNRDLRSVVSHLHNENLQLNQLLAEDGKAALEREGQTRLFLEREYREQLRGAEGRLKEELHEKLDERTKIIFNQHRKLQDDLFLLKYNITEFDARYRQIDDKRRILHIDNSINKEMNEMMAKEIVALKKKLAQTEERRRQADELVCQLRGQLHLQQDGCGIARSPEELMSARSGAGASREGSRPEGGGVGFDINAQLASLQREVSRCKKRENSIREQRDLWRVRAIKLEQMCTGLKDDLSAAIEAAKTLVQSNAQAGETRPEVGGFDTALEAECKGDLAALSQGEVYSYVQSISSGLDAWSSGSAGLPAKGRATRPASAAHPRTSQSRPGSARPKPSGKSRPKSALPTSGTTNLLGRISQAPERPAVSGEKHESVIRVRDLCPPPETMDGKGDDTAPLAMRASATGLTDHSNSSASPVAPPGGLTTGSVSKPELRPKQVGRCSSGYSATIPEEEAPDQRDASSSGYRSSEKLVQPSHECQRQPDINIAGMHGSRTSIYTSGENTPLSGASLPQPRQRPASARPLPTSSARPPSARPNHARPRPMSAVTPQWSSYSDLAQTSDSGGCRPQVVSSAVDGTRREYRTSSQETSSATSTVIRRAQSAGCDKHYKSAAADKLVRRGQSASDFIRRTRSEFMYNGRPFS